MHAGYQPANQIPGGRAPLFRQVTLAVDISNATGAMVALCSVAFTTLFPAVWLVGELSGQVTVTSDLIADMTIDGGVVALGGTTAAAATQGVQGIGFSLAQALAPGLHTFELRFRTTAGGTALCRPATQIKEHAMLTVCQGFMA